MKKMQCKCVKYKKSDKTSLVLLSLRIYAARIHGHHRESSDSFEYPKHSYLNQAALKKIACKGGEKRRPKIRLLFAG